MKRVLPPSEKVRRLPGGALAVVFGVGFAFASVFARANATAGAATAAQAVRRPALAAFDFQGRAGEQLRLPRALREISGLAVTSDGRVFAHADERGMVSQIDYHGRTIVKSFSLGSPILAGDFEGIAIAGRRFFLITSTGSLFESGEGSDGAAVPYTVLDTGFGRACELEGLAYDPSDRSLLIGCKQPRARELRELVTVFRWSIDRRQPATPPRISLPMAAVVRGTGTKAFHPSAIERDAGTGHYVVLAGPQSALAEITSSGTLVATRTLPRKAHPQPEGIALLGDSVLLIADEGGGGPATLTAYRRVR